MYHRVVRKQPNSKSCLVCGMRNPLGLKGAFYELDNGELLCTFVPAEEHQSYPGRLHGGIAAAILDETIGRAIMMGTEEEVWGVTAEFTIRYRKPIPLEAPLRVVARITRRGGRVFEGTGEILLEDGSVAAEGEGRYIRMPLERISEFDREQEEWRVVAHPGDREGFEL
ncbi:MAG: PaaI family thioesterase [Spirochaetales bacterium]|nr:PaaI family thioesterase [Spirochaetales bacterium]